MRGSGPLSFDAIINDVNFSQSTARMERQILGVTQTASRETDKLDRQFARLGQLAAGYFSFQALSRLPAQILKVRGEFQQLEIAFSTMLASKTKADALLGSLVETAATTPFSLKDVASGAKMLLAYGTASGSVVKELRMLGDVASGVSVPIGELIYLYGTLRTQGRAYAVDIRQFAGRGIPIYAELAKVLGVSVDKVNDFVESGKVGFKEVEQAFKNMTSTGGLFAGLMDAQSKSLLGLKERLADAWDLMLNEIGKKNEGVATVLLTTATDAVEHYQDFIDTLKVVATVYGTYKTALLLANVAQLKDIAITEAQAIAKATAATSNSYLTLSQTRAAASTALLTRAQAALNSTMLANPYVLVATAIAGLVAAYFAFREEVTDLVSAQDLLAEAGKDNSSRYEKEAIDINRLVDIIGNHNVAESERLKAYEKLNAVAPQILKNLDFEKAKTADLTKATNEYLTSLKQKIRLESNEKALVESLDQRKTAEGEYNQKVKEYLDLQERVNKANKQARQVGPNGTGATTAGVLQLKQAEREMDAALVRLNAADKIVNKIAENADGIFKEGTKEALEAEIRSLEARAATLPKLSLAYKQHEDQLNKARKQLESLNNVSTKESFTEKLAKAETVGQFRLIRTLADTDEKVEALSKKIKEKLAVATYGTKERAGLKALSDDLDKLTKANKKGDNTTGPLGSLEYYQAVSKKADETLSKLNAGDSGKIAQQRAIKMDAERKIAELKTLLESPAGTLKYYENIIAAAQQALTVTPETDTAGIAKQRQIILDAKQETERLGLVIAVRSFDEEIDYKRTQYELYTKWVESYGKQSADDQFKSLLQNGQSYVDYLDQQIALLNAKGSKLSEQDIKSLVDLNRQKDEQIGKKTGLQEFTEGLEKAQREAGNLTEYLEKLRAKQAELNPSDRSKEGNDKRQSVAQAIVDTERQRAEQLNGFLINIANSEQQQTAIHRQYADLRAELDKKYADKKSQTYQTALASINRAEKEELEGAQKRGAQETDEAKKLTKVILEEGRKRLKIQIAVQSEYVQKMKNKYGEQSEEYKQALYDLNQLTNQLNRLDLSTVTGYTQLLGNLSEAFTTLGGEGSRAGQILSALPAQINLLSKVFEKGVDKSQLYATAIQGTLQVLGSIAEAAAQRKQADLEYYSAVIAQQQQYNLLLNEQVGNKTKSQENVFVRNFVGELQDGLEQYDKASKKYDEALKKLAEGKAKAGLKNVLDQKSALQLIGGGAATGAAIGAIGGPAGAVLGGLIGALAGGVAAAFGGAKKKANEFKSILELYPDIIQKGTDGVDRLNVGLAESLVQQGLVDDATKQTLESVIAWQKQMEQAKEAIKGVVSALSSSLGDSLRSSLIDAFQAGEDAALAFKKSVSAVMDDIVSRILFQKAFGELFDKLEKDLTAALGDGGDPNAIIGVFDKFTESSASRLEQFNQLLKAYQDAAKRASLDALPSTKTVDSATNNPNSLSGAIKGVTEDTASVLAGQINAIRITQADTNGIIRQQLVQLTTIANNTGYLLSIDRRLERMENRPTPTDPSRAKGL